MLASLDSARQELTHALATGAAMPLGRNYLRRLADCVHELAGLTFQRVCCQGAIRPAGPPLGRFVEAGIAARTAAKATPELAQRGVVKAGPLSPALCDQQAAQKTHSPARQQTQFYPRTPIHPSNTGQSRHQLRRGRLH
ncbi:hypothetical protein Pmani_026278 [Petrolisthes manimaculis]|uniref:Uncharacterized protein n=1 Tax=Petrolisthes manimaculis TaxID=1843537 RepID=A0AAE1P3L3_9EUCA|nr:hypothetical protein Pmani_026278 [Petrolisthes manimaculis]